MNVEDRYDSLFKWYAEQNGFEGKDWLRFKAQVRAESNFKSDAVSPVGAEGLAQFMPATWKEWGKGKRVDNPEANIDAQVRYMKWLLKRVTTWECAFAAYNWGIGNVLKIWTEPFWKSKLPEETRNYLARIEKFYQEYSYGN